MPSNSITTASFSEQFLKENKILRNMGNRNISITGQSVQNQFSYLVKAVKFSKQQY